MPLRDFSTSFSSLSGLTTATTTLCRALLVLAVAGALLLTGQASPSGDASAGSASVDPIDAMDARDLRPVAARATMVRTALSVARNQVGDPYKYGAAGPNRFDCSGLVYFSTHRAGFGNVPRTSSAQSRHMRRIKRSAMRPGDFVFFHNRSGVYHVGIFLGVKDGRRRIVHSPGSGQRVKRSAIWTSSWFPGTLRAG